MRRSIVMHTGYEPPPRAAIVLLSGMDSAAAMHWAMDRYAPVHALGIDYGQPHRDAELSAAQAIAERRGVPWHREPAVCFSRLSPEAGRDAAGVSRAFVPGRNARLVWQAASVAAGLFPGWKVAIVVGCNLDDSAGFPDCRPEFLKGLSDNVGMGLAGRCNVVVEAPWAPWLAPGASKADIVRWASTRPAALEDIRYAVSCYRGTRCGECDACTLRARAFAEAGIADGTEPSPKMHGGDPAREAALK